MALTKVTYSMIEGAPISVTDFGAVGDGVTDDTAAFNAAAQYIRDNAVRYFTTPQIVDFVNVSLVIPAGTYNITSWNLTGIQIRNFFIIGEGSVIVGTENNKAVVDAINSRWIHFNGLTITNATDVVPYCGLQVGKLTDNGTVGNNIYSQLTINGNWSLAAYFNSGTETSGHFNCNYQNNISDVNTYAAVQDGIYYYPNISDYVTVTRTTGVGTSFTDNSFYNCHIRHQGTGVGLFISGSSDHYYAKGCYFNSRGAACVKFYQTAARRNYNISINGMFEFGALSVLFDGVGSTTIQNLSIDAGAVRSDNGFFGVVNLTSLSVRNGSFSASFGNSIFESTCSVIDWLGSINCSDANMVNLSNISKFTGTLYTDNFSDITLPTNGGSFVVYDQSAEKTITVVDKTNRDLELYSPDVSGNGAIVRFEGVADNVTGRLSAKGSGDIWLGNAKRLATLIVRADDTTTNSYAIAESKDGEFLLSAGGGTTDVDMHLGTQGAGKVKFGTRTATSDAPITGYIEIKDASGTIRKLAIIS